MVVMKQRFVPAFIIFPEFKALELPVGDISPFKFVR